MLDPRRPSNTTATYTNTPTHKLTKENMGVDSESEKKQILKLRKEICFKAKQEKERERGKEKIRRPSQRKLPEVRKIAAVPNLPSQAG